MLAYSISLDLEKSSVLDKVLCEEDTLYQSVISKLKADGKFIHHLLSLDEIQDDFKVDIRKFTLEKLPIVCGVLVDTQDHGLPTLHSALQTVFFICIVRFVNYWCHMFCSILKEWIIHIF